MQTLCGSIERIVYTNKENGFSVLRFQEENNKNLVTAVGSLSGISPGQPLKISGQWVKNQQYGNQFQIKNYSPIEPTTTNSMEKYLGSGLIKGIGPVTAKEIIKAFGTEAFSIIENYPERLSEANGIGPKKAETIKKAWVEQKEVKEIMIFLQDHNISLSLAVKIHKKYSSNSIETVKNNPIN